MEPLRVGLIVLCWLLSPVSCTAAPAESYFTSPVTCYMLDGFLIIYSLIATALYFREKFSAMRSLPVEVPEIDEGEYQVLQGTAQVDPCELLELTKRKKQARRKNRPQAAGGAGSQVPMLVIGTENVQTIS